jgi:TolA-binding protein
MNREELRAMGLTEEQIESVMKSHGQSTQSLQAQIAQNNLEMARLRGVEMEYTAFKAQKPKEEPKKVENPEMLEAQRQIAELRSEMNRKDIANYALSKGISGEQSANILLAFGDNVESAKLAIDSISQIISDTDKSARDSEKQMWLNGTPNPSGNVTPPANEPTQAEQIALALGKSANATNKQSEAIIASYTN